MLRDASIRKRAQAEENRRRLTEFLGGLDPALRAYLTGEGSLEDLSAWLHLPEERGDEWQRAAETYQHLVAQIPEERARFRRRNGTVSAKRMLRVPRGAPTKPVEERRDVKVARLVAEAEVRLGQGFALCQAHRRRGAFASEYQEIRRELKRAGYEADEIDAIQQGRRLRSAAAYLVASRTGRDVDVVQALVKRGLAAARQDKKTPQQ